MSTLQIHHGFECDNTLDAIVRFVQPYVNYDSLSYDIHIQ